MDPYKDKRSSGRAKRELSLEIKTTAGAKLAYTIDFSHGGVKVGGVQLSLPVGEQVEITIQTLGQQFSFSGQVIREDGLHYLNRIGRDVSTFVIRITDERFTEFVKSNYHV